MSILLAIDTSGPVAGVALLKDGCLAYEAAAVNKLTHSGSLMPMVEEAYTRASLSIDQTDFFAVTVGPGSFTGVRIGVSTVKALAHVRNTPCIAVDALESMAAGIQLFDGILCPIQDARAGQVYGAAFADGFRLMPDTPLKIEEYCEAILRYNRPALFTGDGMPVHRAAISRIMGEAARFAPPHLAYLRPAALAALAFDKRDQAVDYLQLQPLYLRAPQAERQKNLRGLGHE